VAQPRLVQRWCSSGSTTGVRRARSGWIDIASMERWNFQAWVLWALAARVAERTSSCSRVGGSGVSGRGRRSAWTAALYGSVETHAPLASGNAGAAHKAAFLPSARLVSVVNWSVPRMVVWFPHLIGWQVQGHGLMQRLRCHLVV
jgi:hypothetical protein